MVDSDKSQHNGADSSQKRPQNTGIKHPGSLPVHLDEALFAEFLSLQNSVLDEMEALILEIENDPDTAKLTKLKRLFHTLKGESAFLNLDDVETLCHKTEDIFESQEHVAFTNILFSVVDWLRTAIAGYSGKGGMPGPIDTILSKINEQYRKKQAHENGMMLDNASVKTGINVNVRTHAGSPEKSKETALPENRNVSIKSGPKVREFVNVDAGRLDKIVNTIGELVIAESMVRQSREINEFASTTLLRHMGHLGKITRELQEISLSLRMVPIKNTFQKMERVVRDLAKKFNKCVRFQLSGEETELDKTVVDKIGDPLMHIVRNAVDHGIEARAEERLKAGKSETATVEMRAFHKGGNIYIEVSDDGRGIDTDSVLKKAVENGIVNKNAVLSEDQITELIFTHGFSTAEAVTGVSGRGVGMDVVRTNIMSLHGDVRVTSRKGEGSVFSIRIPLTLAIIDGMIIRAGKECYIIPTASIVRSKKYDKTEVVTVQHKGEMISVHGNFVPLFRLDFIFNIEKINSCDESSVIIIVEDNGQRAGLLVDDILGKQQIVIKSLGDGMKNIAGISGGTIMPDGRVGLILDVGGIVKIVNKNAHSSTTEDTSQDRF